MPSRRGGEGSGWGPGVPGERGDAAPRSPAGRDGHRRRPGPAAAGRPRRSPAGSSPAQARRWDLQQSLQETPGPVIRQEISALPDGQAGRVRLSACSFPRWALLVLLERGRCQGRGWGNKAAGPGSGMRCARRGSGAVRLPQASPARPGPLPALSAGTRGGLFGLLLPSIKIYVYVYR